MSTLSSVVDVPGGEAASAPQSSEPHAAKLPRKSRIPKHVVPGVTPLPDPERWLKKRERTSTHRYDGRRRGQRGAGMGIGATQGSTVLDPTTTSHARAAGEGVDKERKARRASDVVQLHGVLMYL